MTSYVKSAVAVLAAAASVTTLPVHAQGNELEEIVVTARKRAESIMKVPVVATVLSQEQISRFATNDIQAISDRVPGLVTGSATLSFGSQLSLRGVGTSTLNATIDQSVSLNIDGMQMTQGLAYKAGLFDMAQVEVFKGPQALFYGKASPGGVIAITTAGPSDEFELLLRQGREFEAEQDVTDFIVSGPITDTFGVRLATTYSERQGYFRNEAEAFAGFDTGAQNPQERDFAPQREWLVRGTAKWQPSAVLSAQLKVNIAEAHTEGDAGALQLASCPDGLAAPQPLPIPFIGGGDDCRIDDTVHIVDVSPNAFIGVRNNGVQFFDQQQNFGTLELNYDLHEALTLTSVSGYYDLQQESMINGTATTSAAPALVADPDFDRTDFTQEIRLTSDYSSAPLNYLLGAFYHDGEMFYRNNVIGNTFYGLPPALNRGEQTIDIESISLFGQLIWAVSPSVEVAIGARWTDEERSIDILNTITGTPTPVAVARPKLSSDNVSPELSVSYFASDDLTLFGSVKQAYKSGSFDTVTIPTAGEDPSFDDEKVTGYELGLKSQLLERHLSLNLAAYYNQYQDMQVGANENRNGEIVIRTLNAASADIYGIDFDFNYLPAALAGVSVYGGFNYNQAEYDKFDNANCWGGQMISEGCNRGFDANTGLYTAQDLSGGDLVRAPDLTANLGVDYELAFNNGLSLTLGVNGSYSDDYYTNLLLRDDMIQDAYTKLNVSAILAGRDNSWEVALIGKNVTDELVSGNCVNANLANAAVFSGVITGGDSRGPAGIDELGCNVEPGREVILRLNVRLDSFL
ncbi:TonB-dependent receptor [Halioxenophilus sp. WMMB6]|uniref:TonB-dependent receptor n=1 Tax=Halioxenophilus sp. WMMB6 TaxID=3073815 RepID=UPI00295F0E31|nr:TonB-dependent receptor [Halioxenophilus sp. WMMB6]